jgi:FkbM family methyltransferase
VNKTIRPDERSRMISNTVEYRYKDFSIQLPAGHMLPIYQQQHPKYDKFLPHLARYIQPSDTVIDVGANVGDTLAGMAAQNSRLNYICIEADELFYAHLQDNIERIKRSELDLNVQTINSLVGKNVAGASLEGKGGTKHAVIGGQAAHKSRLLDELLAEVSHSSIRILKSDVDGFDYDVLDSSAATIHDQKPILFFECHYDHEYQKSGYERTLHSLESEGYCDWTIFDNFGEVLVRTGILAVVIQLMRYIWNQNIGRATRTIYYLDVLAVQSKDTALINRVIADYD